MLCLAVTGEGENGEQGEAEQSAALSTTAATSRPRNRGSAETVTEPARIADEENDPQADRFLDREESWLRFNQRVLELAEDPDIPLLERVRFLAIFASNLDEFFMVRVAGLARRLATGIAVPAPGGRHPREQLRRISEVVHELGRRHAQVFHGPISKALETAGIMLVRWAELRPTERERMHQLFREQIYPVLTPFAVDPAHPFPHISGRSLNLGIFVRDPSRSNGRRVFARIKVPSVLPRFIALGGDRFVPVEDVIAAHLSQLFAGMEIIEHHAFRVTRNADLEVDEDETDNLLKSLEHELLRRRFGPLVRLEVEDTISDDALALLSRELGAEPGEVYRTQGPLDLSGLTQLADLDRPELKYSPFVPVEPPELIDGTLFDAMRERELLVHHPYESFNTSVVRFLADAARDPKVLAIKQTLYRTSGDSPIVDALIDAAAAGKEVVVLVELKARFDEQNNISWARKLEDAGCHVVYGLVGLKTHCKLALVVRQEDDGTLRRYCHIGTGNYNPSTARIYEDLGLFSCAPEVGQDISDLFNHLTGFSRDVSYRRLLVAPHALRQGLLDRIQGEIDHHRAKRPARIRAKTNSLVDEEIVDALYTASRAGVPIDLWVRGGCVLRPGIPGLSETIRVRSILGRFLEHSRIFAFDNGGDTDMWIGSADLMPRNMDRRVEALVRIADPDHCERLTEIMDMAMSDTVSSWHLAPDGSWTRHSRDADGEPLRDIQRWLRRHRHLRSVDG